ncbi:MAG TPA: hypothetical protein EYP10_04240 [Armatimonadetes bacterium]|nr:hypothetical protein [Armatimonadota bacterium]
MSGHDYGGYLCNVTPDEYNRRYRHLLPARIKGDEFIKKYGETDDPVTQIDLDETYSVRGCTEHPIYENHRVQRFIALLDEANRTGDERALIRAGELMYASHWSYSKRVALGCKETDLLVTLARRYGVKHGIYGAKITGGGSGGTVAFLIRDDALPIINRIAEIYHERTGLMPQIFAGSSPGAYQFGCRRLKLHS